MKVLHGDMTNVGYLSHLPWLFPFVKLAPGLNSEHLKFWKFCSGLVDDRIKVCSACISYGCLSSNIHIDEAGSARRFHVAPGRFPILRSDNRDQEQSRRRCIPDRRCRKACCYSALEIRYANHRSDTTAATLTSLFFELARNKEQMANLRRELDPYFASEKIDYVSLSKLKHLDAVINEAMRLHPAVPSGVQRQTPPEGLLIGNTFIPGNTIMKVPLHTVFRGMFRSNASPHPFVSLTLDPDSRSFDRPLEFIPERWTTRPELTKDASVFTPFSTGKCPPPPLCHFLSLC